MPPRRADHRRIVGAQPQRGDGHTHPPQPLSRRVAQSGVGGDPADHRGALDPGDLDRRRQPGHQLIDDRRLEARRQSGHHRGITRRALLRQGVRTEVAHHVAHRGLQAAEREGTGKPRPGQSEAVAIPVAGRALHRRSTRIAETKHPGHLVEGLAGRVVAGRPQSLGRAVVTQQDALGVTAADHQGDVGRLERGVGEPGAVDVTREV